MALRQTFNPLSGQFDQVSDLTLAAVGATPNANAASISASQILTLQPADATFPGVVTTGTQTFAGAKTFTGAITASNLSGTNTGDVTLAAVGATPNANGASLSGQVLNLQPADASFPGVVTTGAQTFAGAKTFSSTIIGSVNGTSANVTGVVAIANGGTGQTTANAGFNALSPMTTGGDLIYGGASGVGTRLANGTAGQVLQSNGTTTAPTWVTPSASPTLLTITPSSTTYTALTTDDVILCDTSGGAWTLTLYTAFGNGGRVLYIKKNTTDNNAVTIDANGGQTIDGELTTTVCTYNECLTIVSDGAVWQVLDRRCDTSWATSLTFVPTNFGTVSGATYHWSRVGDSMRIRGRFTGATMAASPGSITLPTGYTIDTNKITVDIPVGHFQQLYINAGAQGVYTQGFGLVLFYDGSDNTNLFIASNTNSSALQKYNCNNFNTNTQFSFDATVPISNWTCGL